MATRVDLNADLGEGAGHDRAVLGAITSASIACGFHAGDPGTMRQTVELAAERGVAIGAHPGLADRASFGRREMAVAGDEAASLVAYQVGALAAIARLAGTPVRHVKLHGALYNMAARDPALADAVARAVRDVDRQLLLFGLSGSALIAAGRQAGLRTVSEAFADRAYLPDGSLAPRTRPDAVIVDAAVVVDRALRMVLDQAVRAVDGTEVPLEVETICVHGDTPGAAALAHRLREALSAAGIQVAAPGAR